MIISWQMCCVLQVQIQSCTAHYSCSSGPLPILGLGFLYGKNESCFFFFSFFKFQMYLITEVCCVGKEWPPLC